MEERAYYPMRTDAAMDDDAPVTVSIGCPTLICFVAAGRCGRAFLAEPIKEFNSQQRERIRIALTKKLLISNSQTGILFYRALTTLFSYYTLLFVRSLRMRYERVCCIYICSEENLPLRA